MRQTSTVTIDSSRRGALVLVGTPIGNLGDLSPRAVEVLGSVDAIACEDTRRTGRLLDHFGLKAPELLVANDHSEADVAARIVRRVSSGDRVALVTDAGMPAVSDPGQVIVAAAVGAGVTIEVVPGPSALDTAIALSGLPAGRFCFEGFLPRKGAARKERLAVLATERRPTVLYEAPHRVRRTLEDLRVACGDDRQVAVLRELTKLHEEHWRGTLAGACAVLDEREPRGEYVLVLAGAEVPSEPDDAQIRNALETARTRGASTRDAVESVSATLGVAHRRVYAIAVDRPDNAAQ